MLLLIFILRELAIEHSVVSFLHYYVFPASKNRCGSMRLEFIIASVNVRFSEVASISRQTRDRCHSRTRHQCAQNVVSIATLHPRVARHLRGLSVSNGEAWTLGTTKFFELLIASLQPAKYFTRITTCCTAPAIRVPFARGFHVFFLIFF